MADPISPAAMPDDRAPSVTWDRGALAWKWTLPLPNGRTLEGTAPTQLAARDAMEAANRPFRDEGQPPKWSAALPEWLAGRSA